MHHIVNDGWSVGVLYRELQELYDAHVAGRTPNLPALQAQYADVSELQYQLAESDEGREQLAYWKEQLGGTLPALNLTSSCVRTATPEFRGGRVRTMLDVDIGESLKKIGRAEGASLYMVGLAAYFVLLHRYTRDEDIVVGSPIAGRTIEHSHCVLPLGRSKRSGRSYVRFAMSPLARLPTKMCRSIKWSPKFSRTAI